MFSFDVALVSLCILLPPLIPSFSHSIGLKRRDVELQHHVFTSHADSSVADGSSTMSFSKLPAALAGVFARLHSLGDGPAAPTDPAASPPPASIDFSDFQRYVTAPSPLERWLARLPLAQIIADAMPPEICALERDESIMRTLADLPSDVLLASLQAALLGIAQVAILRRERSFS